MILNEAMGWSGYHVFEFYHLELHIMEEVDDFVGFGPWDYRVTVEKVLDDYKENYPKVIKYKGDRPVENCGGIWGYYACLDVIADPSDPEYEDRLAWMEMQGYPNEYDMEAVNQKLRERFFYKWGKGEKHCQGSVERGAGFSNICWNEKGAVALSVGASLRILKASSKRQKWGV